MRKIEKIWKKYLNTKDVIVYYGLNPKSMIQGWTCSQTFPKKVDKQLDVLNTRKNTGKVQGDILYKKA
jgi:hypothetical protein